MGKILMFRDADFSAVAVAQVPTGGVELTPTILNVTTEIDVNGKIVSNSAHPDWRVYYVPVVAGRVYHLSIVWSAAHYQRIGVSSALPAVNVVLSPMLVNQQGGAAYATTTADVTYTASFNGYLAWQMHVPHTISCAIQEWQ